MNIFTKSAIVVFLFVFALPAAAQTVGVLGLSNTNLSWEQGYQVVAPNPVGWPEGGRGGCNIHRIANQIGATGSCTDYFETWAQQYGQPSIILWQLGNDESRAQSPVPTPETRNSFKTVLQWVRTNYPGVPIYLTSLPDYDDSAFCKGGQSEWYDFEVSNTLIDLAVQRGWAERADIDWDPYFLEDVRAGDPQCALTDTCDDYCHQDDGRIEEDGHTLDAWVGSLGL